MPSLKSGQASSTSTPALRRLRAPFRQMAPTSGSILDKERLLLKATRRGATGDFVASTNGLSGGGLDHGSPVVRVASASSIRATSLTVRPIGPSTHNASNGGFAAGRGTRPTLGRRPTMPQKLAGMRKLPPRSFPEASQTMPAANAAAAPPEEPPADRPRSQGLRVAP